jgi:Flp pilus assembly protein TadB
METEEFREIRIRVPRLGGELVSNLLGLAGLVAVVVAVGGLTHNAWWSVLSAGVVLAGLATIAQVSMASATERRQPRQARQGGVVQPPGRRAA